MHLRFNFNDASNRFAFNVIDIKSALISLNPKPQQKSVLQMKTSFKLWMGVFDCIIVHLKHKYFQKIASSELILN